MAKARAGTHPLGKNRVARPPSPASELPAVLTETDRPSLARLSAVVALCFALGVAWPVLGKLDFVQRPPGSAAAKAEEIEPLPNEPDPNAAVAPEIGEVAAMRATPALTTEQSVRVESHIVQSCQGDAGEAVARCDQPRLQPALQGPIAKLAACEQASGASGLLSLGLYLDFSRGRITRVKAGQSTTLPKATATGLLACAEDAVVGTRLDDIEHEHGRYWVYFLVRFLPPGSPVDAAPTSDKVVNASGQVTIDFTTAAVRESPSRRAKVTTRLTYGTRVNVTGRSGDWYRVEQAGKSLGWVQRKALGM